jgi:hypothetical protein
MLIGKMNPYTQTIKDNKIIRHFKPNVDADELIWHRDRKDRKITIIKNEGWLFQRDNELPQIMSDNFIINKGEYHRVIKGHGELIIEIEEY